MRDGRLHRLKTHPSAWCAVRDGRKTWEYRRNDRDFQVGDVLRLEFFDPAPSSTASDFSRSPEGYLYKDGLPGRVSIEARVTYILHGGQFGIPVGFCVMTIAPEPSDD